VATIKRNEIIIKRKNGNVKILHLKKKKLSKPPKRLI